WCFGSDWSAFTAAEIEAGLGKSAELQRRSALRIIRQVGEKICAPAELQLHAAVLLQRHMAIEAAAAVSSARSVAAEAAARAKAARAAGAARASPPLWSGTGEDTKFAGLTPLSPTRVPLDPSPSVGAGSGGVGAGAAAAAAAGGGASYRETNVFSVASACLILANKAMRARVPAAVARPLRAVALLSAAYAVQFPGRGMDRNSDDAKRWQAKVLAAEHCVLASLDFDLFMPEPLRMLRFGGPAMLPKKSAELLLESALQGLSLWLRFPVQTVAAASTLVAAATTLDRGQLETRALAVAEFAGPVWAQVLECCAEMSAGLLPAPSASPAAALLAE
ncbi:unnamed protein product, partial [Phaeothamnion confervicola]